MFELHILAFIIGGVLAVVGILGGGLEIKELKVPSINPVTRGLAVIVGLLFVGLGIYLDIMDKSKQSPDIGKESTQTISTDNAKAESGVPLQKDDKKEIENTLKKYGRVKEEGYSDLDVNAWEKVLIDPVLEHKKRGTCRFIDRNQYYKFGDRIIDVREINFDQDRSHAQVVAMVAEEKVLKDGGTDEIMKETPLESDRAIYELEKKNDRWFISCISIWKEGEFKQCTMGPVGGEPCEPN